MPAQLGYAPVHTLSSQSGSVRLKTNDSFQSGFGRDEAYADVREGFAGSGLS